MAVPAVPAACDARARLSGVAIAVPGRWRANRLTFRPAAAAAAVRSGRGWSASATAGPAPARPRPGESPAVPTASGARIRPSGVATALPSGHQAIAWPFTIARRRSPSRPARMGASGGGTGVCARPGQAAGHRGLSGAAGFRATPQIVTLQEAPATPLPAIRQPARFARAFRPVGACGGDCGGRRRVSIRPVMPFPCDRFAVVGRPLAVLDVVRRPLRKSWKRQQDGETPSLRRCVAVSPRGRARTAPGQSEAIKRRRYQAHSSACPRTGVEGRAGRSPAKGRALWADPVIDLGHRPGRRRRRLERPGTPAVPAGAQKPVRAAHAKKTPGREPRGRSRASDAAIRSSG